VSRAYWSPDDPIGHRSFTGIGALDLEVGGKLTDIQIAYETWGNFTGGNAVLVEHALTGDAHVVGPAGAGHRTPGWWDGLVGPGRPLDTERYFVVASNVLGGCQGSTGPSSPAPDGLPYGSRFGPITVRDQVSAEIALADQLGIAAWELVVGGSMGGMRALEWAVTAPDRVGRLALVASNAAATAEQIALCTVQLQAIRSDPSWLGGDYYAARVVPAAGLGIARRIAHISYRSEYELGQRFGRQSQAAFDPGAREDLFAVASYLDHQADKLVGRFDAGSYVVLTEAMNAYDIGRGRGGVQAALAQVSAATLVVAVDSDRLYLPSQQRELAAGITGARYHEVTSPYGHDGFLIEVGQVGAAIRTLLDP